MLIKPQSDNLARIKVVGVGGGGNNAINNMISNYDIEGVEFIAINTDGQALSQSNAEVKLRIGEELTRGLGSGGNPNIGKKAAEESIDMLHEHLAGADMVFITAGMGGGTGTGASPIIAGVAKNLGALTVAIVTKPFKFEGKRRMETALRGIEDLKNKVDTLIVVPNQKLLDIIDQNISFLDAMKQVDDVLGHATKSISQLITKAGLINVDFADVKSVMVDAGTALMGMGSAKGEGRAQAAAQLAVTSPLLEVSVQGATGVLFNVIGGADLGMHEVDQAAQFIADSVDADANIIFGATIDPEMKEEIEITVLATGFDSASEKAILTDTADQFRQQRKQATEGTTLGGIRAQVDQPGNSQANNQTAAGGNQQQPQNTNNAPDEDQGQPPQPQETMNDYKKPQQPIDNYFNRSSNTISEESEEDLETPSFLRRKKDY